MCCGSSPIVSIHLQLCCVASEQESENRLELFQIWLNLPKASKMAEPYFKMLWKEQQQTHTITDAAGKTVQVLRTAGVQGKNILTLERKDLPAGVLFYTLTTDDFTATKSMVIE